MPFEKTCSSNTTKTYTTAKTSPIFLTFSPNAEHSESNTRSVMKNPKIIKIYSKALSLILKVPWCSIIMRSMFLKQTSKTCCKRSLPGYFSPNTEHSESNISQGSTGVVKSHMFPKKSEKSHLLRGITMTLKSIFTSS